MLKAKRPDTFGERTEITDRDGSTLFAPPATMSDEELQAGLTEALERLAGVTGVRAVLGESAAMRAVDAIPDNVNEDGTHPPSGEDA